MNTQLLEHYRHSINGGWYVTISPGREQQEVRELTEEKEGVVQQSE